MKRYRRIELVALAGFLVGGLYFFFEPSVSRFLLYHVLKNRIRAEIPVDFSYFDDQPLIEVKIENSTFKLLFDLGSSAFIKLFPEKIEKLGTKHSSGKSRYFDLNGNAHESFVYSIPRVAVANFEFHDVLVDEEIKNQILSVGVVRSSAENLSPYLQKTLQITDGKIGRLAFLEFDCLIDFARSKVFLIEPQKETAEKSLLSAGFIKIPFLLNKYGISIKFKTDIGDVNLILDTGANCCLLKRHVFPFTEEKQLWRTELSVSGIDFGTWHFWLGSLGTKYPEFDGLLGVDFFLKNTIYLDFVNQFAYIKKNRFKSLGSS